MSEHVAYTWVETPEALAKAIEKLRRAPRLYLDTEFESNKNGTRLCLLQISDGEEIFLIDPLRLDKLDELGDALARPEAEWVLHAGLQDVELLERRLHVRAPKKLFDTQIAYALSSAEHNVSLAYLLYKLLGVRSDKAHQTDDWLRRPLPETQLAYAASDVEHLPELAARLRERAEAKDRLDLVHRASWETLEPTRDPPAPLRLESFRNAWQLGPKNQAGLRFLIDWYNALSEDDKRDAPETKTLLALASRLPETPDVLARIKGVPRGFSQRHGKRVVLGLLEAARQAKGDDFVPIEPPPYGSFPEVRLEAWLGWARAEICTALEVAPELVLPSRILRELKNQLLSEPPTELTRTLTGYRELLLGEALRRFCEKHPPPV